MKKISDELIACYVEGKASIDERNIVRRYLCEHPEEYERVLCLMDNDKVDYLKEQDEVEKKCVMDSKSPFTETMHFSKSFVAEQKKLSAERCEFKFKRRCSSGSFLDRLNKLNDEVKGVDLDDLDEI